MNTSFALLCFFALIASLVSSASFVNFNSKWLSLNGGASAPAKATTVKAVPVKKVVDTKAKAKADADAKKKADELKAKSKKEADATKAKAAAEAKKLADKVKADAAKKCAPAKKAAPKK